MNIVDRTGRPPGLVENCSYSSALCSARLKQKKKDQSQCLFFLPAEKASIDAFGYAALLETRSSFNLAFLSYFLSFLPSLSHPGAGGELVKSAAICRYKNNPGFIGIAMGGWHRGEVRVKWLYSTIHLSYQKELHCYILY